jgi:20S proteasome subunit alpha 6
MFRNQYDTDITTWSPQGRLHQVEYAMEAVKHGGATVGAKSNTHGVVVALKRAFENELCSYQSKMFKLDKHVGMAISGMTSDARYLARVMRTELLNHRYVYESALPVQRLVVSVSDKAQASTQRSSKRPLGVGTLVVGVDKAGPCLFETCPSGQYWHYKANAIGARSQSARTYLERHYESFADCSLDELVVHALKALAATCAEGVELNQNNTSVGIVGIGQDFEMFDDAAVAPWLDKYQSAGGATRGAAGNAPAATGGDVVPMQE